MTDVERDELVQPDQRDEAPVVEAAAADEPAADEPAADAPAADDEPAATDELAEAVDESTTETAEDAGEAAEETDEGGSMDLVALAAEDPRSREELLAELLDAEARRDEYLEDVRRGRAEFENYRKRIMREGAAQREAGKAEAAAQLLEVLDDLDRTLEAAETSQDEHLAKGVELVASKLVGALQGLGLERLDAAGVAFDPTRHEAVQHREASEPRDDGPTVVEVLRPGYQLGGRVLRPAMVVVEE